MDILQTVSEDEALLALRRTLWQLGVMGLAAAVAVEGMVPDAGAVALWCVLAPLSALAVHFRHELRALWPARRRDPEQRPRARHGGWQRAGARRRSGMASRRSRSAELAGAR